MSRDIRSKAERALPPWANEIHIDNADEKDNAAETAVVIHDRKGSSEAQLSEDSANAGSYTRVTRLEVDADILDLFKSSLAEAINRWRDLYSRRARRGTNKDLSIFTCAAAALVPARADRLMVHRGLIRDDHGFFTFVEDVLSQSDFFDEYPDFVTNMLDVVYNICNKAGDDPVLRSRALRLAETACRNAWERRWLLQDDKEIERR
ncbi:hypothetical protein PENSPDRAFT_395300 [Peniophora sp. CONT]|nr:hypothetical protein PENSPDRAFT_395300 [Peniophora sp. CONT]